MHLMYLPIFRFGPLVRHWTMRYEAKHSYFKRLAQSMGNFVNAPYSLAMRHQLYQCYLNLNTSVLPGFADGQNLETGPGMLHSFPNVLLLLFVGEVISDELLSFTTLLGCSVSSIYRWAHFSYLSTSKIKYTAHALTYTVTHKHTHTVIHAPG